MLAFDFISGDEFRNSLEGDYRELNLCMEAAAWKAACVLAGSIIEAVLVDYLLALGYSKSDPLKMTFDQVIQACKQEGILSPKTVGLSNAVRLYRNLIHPGRAIRLGEVIDENGARIALPLVEIIVGEVTSHKEQTYGPTAEQIASKVERDPKSISVMRHLLREAKPVEIERLLLVVIAHRYFELLDSGVSPGDAPLPSFEECFRSAVGVASNDVKIKMAERFVNILKEESDWMVHTYETGFFRAKDLAYLSSQDRQLVKEHLLTRPDETLPDTRYLRTMEGIGPFLAGTEIAAFAGPIIRAILSWDIPVLDIDSLRKGGLDRVEREYWSMEPAARTEMCNWLRDWIARSEQKEQRPLEEVNLADQMGYLLAAFETYLPS